MHNNRLEAKIAARNKVNDHAQKVYDVLMPIFAAWPKDKKAVNNDGSFVVKLKEQVKAALDKFEAEFKPFQVYCSVQYSSVICTVRACETSPCRSGGGIATYADQSVYLMETKGNLLIHPPYHPNGYPRPTGRTDYKAEEIIAARAEASRLRDLARAQEFLYCNFGDHDNN